MSGKISPQLTHAGLWVWDLTRMEDFYTRVLGLSVSDRGYVERYQGNIVFLSANPEIHHQLVLCEGRREGSKSTVNQLSFTVRSLQELKEMHRRVLCEGIESKPRNHGNAWSIYFDDPEGNNVEVYLDSPFHVPQPRGETLDLDRSDEEIIQTTRAAIRATEGFMQREEWAARRTKRMKEE